jgi:hypothetical protein
VLIHRGVPFLSLFLQILLNCLANERTHRRSGLLGDHLEFILMVFPEPDVRANHRCLCTPRGVYVSSKIRISAENNSVRRRRYQKMEIENDSLLNSAVRRTRHRKRKSKTNRSSIRPGGPWSSLVTAGMGAWGWGHRGYPKEGRGADPRQYRRKKFWRIWLFVARAEHIGCVWGVRSFGTFSPLIPNCKRRGIPPLRLTSGSVG